MADFKQPINWDEFVPALTTPFGFGAMQPNLKFSMESDRPMGPPNLRGSASVPFGGGDLELRGNYQANQNMPPEWSAILNYLRKF